MGKRAKRRSHRRETSPAHRLTPGADRPRPAPLKSAPVTLSEDRSILVPPGARVMTGYVRVDRVRLACRDRMALGDVAEKYNRRLQLGDSQPWPCPRGHWDGETFVIIDGRHDYVACLMLGLEYILVCWVVNDG